MLAGYDPEGYAGWRVLSIRARRIDHSPFHPFGLYNHSVYSGPKGDLLERLLHKFVLFQVTIIHSIQDAQFLLT